MSGPRNCPTTSSSLSEDHRAARAGRTCSRLWTSAAAPGHCRSSRAIRVKRPSFAHLSAILPPAVELFRPLVDDLFELVHHRLELFGGQQVLDDEKAVVEVLLYLLLTECHGVSSGLVSPRFGERPPEFLSIVTVLSSRSPGQAPGSPSPFERVIRRIGGEEEWVRWAGRSAVGRAGDATVAAGTGSEAPPDRSSRAARSSSTEVFGRSRVTNTMRVR